MGNTHSALPHDPLEPIGSQPVASATTISNESEQVKPVVSFIGLYNLLYWYIGVYIHFPRTKDTSLFIYVISFVVLLTVITQIVRLK